MHPKIIGALAAAMVGAASAQEATQLPTVTVDAAPAYAATAAESTSRTSLPLKDQAASIQVVPGQVLRDRGVTRTDQLLDNVSGVQAEASYGGNGATFFNIRGFSESNGLRDGFRNFGYIAFRDVQNIEQVEVFKGPAGALYGGIGAVGGYVNTVSKRPERENFGEVGLTAGSYGLVRTTLDLNRVIDDNLSVRLNGAVEDNATFRDNAGYASWSLAPSIAWNNRRGTSLTLLTEFNHLRRDGFDFGIPNVANYRDLSRSRYYGLAGGMYAGVPGDYGKNDTQSATLLFEHQLDERWKLRAAAQYARARQQSTQTFPTSTNPVGNLLDFAVYRDADEASRQYAVRTELVGDFTAGGLRHALLAGVDYGYLEQGSRGSGVSGMTLDLFDPAYRSGLTPGDPLTSHQGQGKNLGAYVQDQVQLTPGVQLMAGLRADRFDNRAIESDVVTGRGGETAYSPRLGVVWQPLDATALFADWSRSHAPNVGHSGSNITYDAEVAKQFEVGVRQELIARRLNATLAVFDLNRSNILTTDPTNPLLQVLTGRQSSRGVELDVGGSITPAWKIIATYTYTDAKVRADTNLPVGDALSNVPRNSASAWSTYRLRSVPGLTVGAGVYYVGARQTTLPNTYPLAGYTRTDAMVSYQSGPWKTQLNIQNLFDRRYYTGGSAAVFNYTLTPSRPLSAQVTVAYRF